VGLLGWQPAEDRAGPRAGPEPRPPPGRAAHPRRGHRRDRVHPPPPGGAARRRQGDPAGLGRAGRDPRAGRPHPGHARRADRRRRSAGCRHRAGARPDDGRGAGGGHGVTPGRGSSRIDWVAVALLPAINLALALLLSAVVVLLVGENPLRALRLLATGAFGDAEGIGYTLYYATNFVFTGLAVAVAFHAGLF